MANVPVDGGGLTIDTFSMAQAGQQMVKDATDLGTQIQTDWKAVQTTVSVMPQYFNNLLSTYEASRKTELNNMVQRRQQVGQLLQKASSLYEFNEQAQQTVFKNMHMGVNPNNTSTTNLTPPDGWTH